MGITVVVALFEPKARVRFGNITAAMTAKLRLKAERLNALLMTIDERIRVKDEVRHILFSKGEARSAPA